MLLSMTLTDPPCGVPFSPGVTTPSSSTPAFNQHRIRLIRRGSPTRCSTNWSNQWWSVLALKEELDRDGIMSKVRVDKYGRGTGGRQLARGALYLMLQNRIYRGEIVHKDNSYPSEHDPIIDQAL